MFLWTPPGLRAGRPARNGGAAYAFQGRYPESKDRQPREPAAALAERCRPVTGQRSCCERASTPYPIAADATSRRGATRTRLLAMRRSRARPRLMLSTTVRPASGRAVLHRPGGGQRRPRANRSSRDWSMPNKILIDATHPEETRVVVLRGHRVEEFDFESASRKQLRGNIYLAKVTRVEPSLQAAFVDYGGNRHGFLAFSEIHPDYYQIPIADRQALIAEEERAQRAAAEEVDRAPRHRRHAVVAREDEVMRGEAVEAPLDRQEAEQPSADQPPATSEESDGEEAAPDAPSPDA